MFTADHLIAQMKQTLHHCWMPVPAPNLEQQSPGLVINAATGIVDPAFLPRALYTITECSYPTRCMPDALETSTITISPSYGVYLY